MSRQAEQSGLSERYHHGDLRAALVAAGLELLATQGPAELSLRALARQVGVSHAATYRHFADKEALLATIAEQGFVLLREQMSAAATAPESTYDERFVACADAYVAFALAHPGHFRVMFSGWAGDRSQHPALSAAADAAFDVLVVSIQAGQAGGALRPGDPRLLALSAWASIHGLAALLLERQLIGPEHGQLDGRRLARRLAGMLLDGLRA